MQQSSIAETSCRSFLQNYHDAFAMKKGTLTKNKNHAVLSSNVSVFAPLYKYLAFRVVTVHMDIK